MLGMTYGGNELYVRNCNTLPIQPVGACIASPVCRRCFPVRVSIGVKRLEQHPRTHTWVRPYAVKENDVGFSRNSDVTFHAVP